MTPFVEDGPFFVFLLYVTISAWPISIHKFKFGCVRTALRKRFGNRLRVLRNAAGISQEAFADRCGLARSYMSRIERGNANPSLDAIEILADGLKVSVKALFED